MDIYFLNKYREFYLLITVKSLICKLTKRTFADAVKVTPKLRDEIAATLIRL